MKIQSIFRLFYQDNLKSILLVILIILFQGGILLLIPLNLNNIYNFGFLEKNIKNFYIYSILLISIYLLILFLDFLIEKLFTKYMLLLPSLKIRQILLEKYFDLPISFYYNTGPAAIFKNISSNLNLALQSFYDFIKNISNILKSFIYLIFVLSINPLYSLFIIFLNILILLLINIIERRKLLILSKQSNEFMKVYDDGYDSLEGEFEIYANNYFKYFFNKMEKSIKKLTMTILSKVDQLFVLSSFIKVFFKKIIPIAFLFIIYLYNYNKQTITFFLSFYFLYLLFPDISGLVGIKLEIKKVEKRWETIINLVEEKNELSGTKIISKYDILIKNFSIELRNNFILQKINLKIPYGQKLLIVGKSGEGKSVFMNSLFGSFYNQQGEVLIGDVPISEIDIENYRKTISYINCNPIIFDQSIFKNIVLDQDISYENVIELITNFSLTEFFKRFSNLNEIISDSMLSSGEKIIVSFLRAIIRKPKILFLDEATGSLDSKLEQKILSIIKSMNITVIAISHNLSVINYFERIICIESGNIVEDIDSKQISKSKYILSIFKDQINKRI